MKASIKYKVGKAADRATRHPKGREQRSEKGLNFLCASAAHSVPLSAGLIQLLKLQHFQVIWSSVVL